MVHSTDRLPPSVLTSKNNFSMLNNCIFANPHCGEAAPRPDY
jgi:hypothetical protein